MVLKDLEANGFEVYTLQEEKEHCAVVDADLINDMELLGCTILLHNGYMARNWYFTTKEAMVEFFKNGGKVGYDDANRKIA